MPNKNAWARVTIDVPRAMVASDLADGETPEALGERIADDVAVTMPVPVSVSVRIVEYNGDGELASAVDAWGYATMPMHID